MAVIEDGSSARIKQALYSELQKLGRDYISYTQSSIPSQFNSITSTINTLIGSVDVGRLDNATAVYVTQLFKNAADIATQSGVDYTNMKAGTLGTLLTGSVRLLIEKNITSDAVLTTVLGKMKEELGAGVFSIFSPLISGGVKLIQNQAQKLLDSAMGMSWKDAANLNSDLSDISAKAAAGEIDTTLDPVTDAVGADLDEISQQEKKWDENAQEGTTLSNYNEYGAREYDFTWALMKDGDALLSGTVYLSDSFESKGKVTTEHIEENSFASYNKLDDGLSGTITVAMQPDYDHDGLIQTQEILEKLKELKEQATTFSVVTPHAEYEDMTLVSYKYDNVQKETATTLKITLTVEKIKNVALASTTTGTTTKVTKAKNASNTKTKTAVNVTPGTKALEQPNTQYSIAVGTNEASSDIATSGFRKPKDTKQVEIIQNKANGVTTQSSTLGK